MREGYRRSQGSAPRHAPGAGVVCGDAVALARGAHLCSISRDTLTFVDLSSEGLSFGFLCHTIAKRSKNLARRCSAVGAPPLGRDLGRNTSSRRQQWIEDVDRV